jgi:hypothetical protein
MTVYHVTVNKVGFIFMSRAQHPLEVYRCIPAVSVHSAYPIALVSNPHVKAYLPEVMSKLIFSFRTVAFNKPRVVAYCTHVVLFSFTRPRSVMKYVGFEVFECLCFK